MLTVEDQRLIEQYLWGELSEEDQAAVEERIFSDDDYCDEVLAREDELINEYVLGRLSPRLRERFERRLSTAPDWHPKIEEVRRLLDALKESRLRKRWLAASLVAWVRRLVEPGWGSPASRLALAVAFVAVIAVAGWLARETSHLHRRIDQLQAVQSRSVLEREAAATRLTEQRARADRLAEQLDAQGEIVGRMEAQLAESTRAGPRRALMSFSLVPGLQRDADPAADGPPTLAIPPGVDVLIKLALPPAVRHDTYRAVLQTPEGHEKREQIWSDEVRHAGPASSSGSLALRISAPILWSGDYIITLQGRTGGVLTDVATYVFSVVRR